jgi:hypothetical protein
VGAIITLICFLRKAENAPLASQVRIHHPEVMHRFVFGCLFWGLACVCLPAQTAVPPTVIKGTGNTSFTLPAAPSPEVRTPEQLQAILEAYVGKWRGDYAMLSPHGSTLALTIEVTYAMETQPDGKKVLKRTTTYQRDGKTINESAVYKVENGKIVAESDRGEQYSARTRGDSLVWFTLDPGRQSTDYWMVETLHLTPTGARISIRGYECLSNSKPPQFVYETADLQRVE